MTRTVTVDTPDPEDWPALMYRNLREVKAHIDELTAGLRRQGLLLDDDAPPPSQPDRSAPALIVLRPGDKVLVALVEDPSQKEADDLAAGLRASFPGVTFTVVGGIAGVCVQT